MSFEKVERKVDGKLRRFDKHTPTVTSLLKLLSYKTLNRVAEDLVTFYTRTPKQGKSETLLLRQQYHTLVVRALKDLYDCRSESLRYIIDHKEDPGAWLDSQVPLDVIHYLPGFLDLLEINMLVEIAAEVEDWDQEWSNDNLSQYTLAVWDAGGRAVREAMEEAVTDTCDGYDNLFVGHLRSVGSGGFEGSEYVRRYPGVEAMIGLNEKNQVEFEQKSERE